MDGKNISVKAHMDHEDGSSEVRRFGLDNSAATSFTYLQGKLRLAFPRLMRQPMEVVWLDGDQDWVALSTDEELVLALTDALQVRGLSTLRLRVALAMPRAQPRPAGADGPVHAGVQCDACNETIRGFRYKCLTCDDYDLCAGCETRNAHPDHVMVRIANPELAWQRFVRWGRRGGGRGPHCGRPGGAGTCGMGGFGGRGDSCHWKGRANEQAKADTAEDTKKTNASTSAATGEQEQFQRPKNFFEAINAAMTALGGFPAEATGSAGAAANRWTEKSLEELGQRIASCLDPFGIDVDVDVGPRNTPSSSSDKKSADKTPPKKPESSQTQQQQQKGTPEPMATTSDAQESATATTEQSSMMDTAPAPAPNAASDVTPIPVTVEDDNGPTDDWTVVNRAGSSSSTPPEEGGPRPRVYPNLATEEPQAAPAAIAAAATSSQTGATAAAAPSQAATPSVSAADESLDPRIQRALDVMAAMGFSNDGGWLTQLLLAKQGDIGAVLDVLQPVRPRQPQTY